MLRPCTSTESRSRCQAELFDSYLVLLKRRGSAFSGEEASCSCSQPPSPTPTGRMKLQPVMTCEPSEIEQRVPNVYISSKNWWYNLPRPTHHHSFQPSPPTHFHCRGFIPAGCSGASLPCMTYGGVSGACIISLQRDRSGRPNPGAPQALSQHQQSLGTSRVCSSPGSCL